MKVSPSLAGAFALAFSLAACGKTTVQGDNAPTGKDQMALTEVGTGCIQGVVINDLTGERLDLPTTSGDNLDLGKGITVRVHDTLLKSTLTNAEYTKNTAMKGEYTLCGIPLENEFPLFAQVDGYLPFGAKVSIASSVAERSVRADTDIQKPMPTVIYNLRLYPIGTETSDLRVRVIYQSVPMGGATVQLTPSDKHVLDQGDFLAPANGELLTLNQTTDANGYAVFPAASLVLGGVYAYTVLPPSGIGRTIVKGDGLVIGLLASKAQHDAYLLQIDLDNTAPALKVVSESKEPNGTGLKTCTLNRPVKLAPSTEDGIAAGLENAVNATIKPSTLGNQSSESVNVSISADGYTISLTPIFDKAPDLTKEPTIAVTYTGVVLMPSDIPQLTDRLNLADQCKLSVNLQ